MIFPRKLSQSYPVVPLSLSFKLTIRNTISTCGFVCVACPLEAFCGYTGHTFPGHKSVKQAA